MSYAIAPSLQAAVYDALIADGDLDALVGDAIFDMAPEGTVPDRFVALGPEKVQARGSVDGLVSEFTFEILVVGKVGGFLPIKEIAARVTEVLHDADLPLTLGSLRQLSFQKAEAFRRVSDDTRRVRLFFVARVEDDPQP